MKITNIYNFPHQIVEALESDYEYKDGQFSATTIIQGIKSFILMKRHTKEIEQDVADMGNLLFGLALHSYLEKVTERPDELKEAYLKYEVKGTGYNVSGRIDMYSESEACLTDWKTCSVWKVRFKSFEEWHFQLMIYAWLLIQYGFPVKKLRIFYLGKDWSSGNFKLETAKGGTYPEHMMGAVEWEFTQKDYEAIDKWLVERFTLIKDYENLPDDLIPNCSDEERFYAGDKWAVYPFTKKGEVAKKAYRVFDTEKEANQFVANSDSKYEIVKRVGEYKKCLEYCNANKFCNFYKKLMEGKKDESQVQ